MLKKTQVYIKNLFISNPKKTYWQKNTEIVGPSVKEDFEETGQKETRNAIEKFILDHSNNSTKLLDAGCNTAVEGYRLFTKKFVGSYVGVDSNPKAINFAKYNLSEFKHAAFIVSDLDTVPFRDKYFDIVLIKDIIEHQEHYELILNELARVTKKYLILSLFIKLSASDRDEIKKHKDGYYLNKYSRTLLHDFLIKKSFKKPVKIYSDAQDEVLIFERKARV